MMQVLFHIPLPGGGSVPVYGFGAMLFLVFLLTTWLASRRAREAGVRPELVQDAILAIFVAGIIGARIVYMISYPEDFPDRSVWGLITAFFQFWNGGIVFYGSAVGGAVGYWIFYQRVLKKHGISTWRVADIIAPSVALGLCLGRVGCFLNGCCFGNVAGPDVPAVHFPMLTCPAQSWLVSSGRQTLLGFVPLDSGGAGVGPVEADSPAAGAGVRAGDVVTAVDGRPVGSAAELLDAVTLQWPRGKHEVQLTVRRGSEEVTLPAFVPRTVGMHPAQLYESVSMLLLLGVLLLITPLRRHDGQVFVVLMVAYSVHRFVNESVRVDNPPVWPLGLTFSQTFSIGLLAFALGLEVFLRRTQPRLRREPERSPAPLGEQGG